MLKLALLAFITIQLVSAKTITKRETCDPAIDLTRVAGTCNQFHRCFNGYYAKITCASGYEFDTKSNSCRPDAEVDCVTRGNECGNEMDYVRVENDCRKYFRCDNGYLKVLSCSEGFVFNWVTKDCDWPKNVEGCQHHYWGNECDASVDLTRAQNDCTKFYRCDRGWLKVESCPDRLVFDNSAKVCNWPEQVPGCERTFWGKECDSTIDYTRVANNCTSYYLCDKGYLKTQSCQDGLVFDNSAKVCNWPEQVPGCERTFWGKECDATADLTRVTDQCTKYYRCVKGYLSVETCPDGLAFDSYLKRCEWANNVKCGKTCTSSQDLTQVENDCSKFYKCNLGVLSTEACPSGYLFDSSIRACNIAFLVNTCNTNQAPVTQAPVTQAPVTQAPSTSQPLPTSTSPAYTPCTAADDMTQVPSKCNLYFRCVNGVLTTESCPKGMNFDRALRACNIDSQVYTCY